MIIMIIIIIITIIIVTIMIMIMIIMIMIMTMTMTMALTMTMTMTMTINGNDNDYDNDNDNDNDNATLVKQSIKMSHFPHDLKKAELSPLYKCKDDLLFTNYRPVSVLTALSKLFERVYNDQMTEHFTELLCSFLSAFRRYFGCHHVLTKLIEDCKIALDSGKNVGLLLLDLSKAFDCLPHRLLLCKLHAYGMSREACKLILSYLRNRLQRVKIASVKSDWSFVIKGVPQGSVLGPLLFNIFLNDIYFVSSHNISIYNYADDNTIGSFNEDIIELKRNLEISAGVTLNWFQNNQIKVNPEKFQTLMVKQANEANDIELNISGQTKNQHPV